MKKIIKVRCSANKVKKVRFSMKNKNKSVLCSINKENKEGKMQYK